MRPRSLVVGLVAFNTRDDTLRALASVRAHGGGRRTVLVDHGDDGTAEAVAERFPEVTVERRSNRGYGAGANRLLAVAHPDDLLLLNADAELTAGAADRLAAALDRVPRAAAVGPALISAAGARLHSAHPFPTLRLAALMNAGGWRLGGGAWRERALLPGAPQPETARRVDWVVGAAMAVRREAVEAVGGFDESFFMYAEDLEWCHRAARGGWEVWVEPSATVVHLGNRSAGQVFGPDPTAAWLESTYRFARRVHGPAWAGAFFALNAAGTSVRWALARGWQAVSPSERASRSVAMWRPYVDFHLRGVRPVTKLRADGA